MHQKTAVFSRATAMSDEAVLDEGVSRFGLYRLHVMGASVDMERWVAERAGGWDFVWAWWFYREEELGMDHLRLWWKTEPRPGGENGQ